MTPRAALALLLLVGALAAEPARAVDLTGERIGTFDQPVYLTGPPDDPEALAVVERYGTVRLVRRGRVLRRPLVDLRRRVLIEDRRETVDQRGLLSVAFAPDYARSGRLYIDYVDRDGRLRVDEWRRRTGRLRKVLDLGKATTQHHGGQLQFGPDGRLYVSTGMGADPETSQDPASPGGKILRVNPLRRRPRPEVVALGLRNPWRFSFDRRTGTALVADVGEGRAEEVNVLRLPAAAPVNFGWPFVEGRSRPTAGAPPDRVAPGLEHLHEDGWCSIVGGYVLRGRRAGALRGRYLYGDVCSGELWSARYSGGALSAARAVGVTVPYLVSFGQDVRGRTYAVSLNGGVWRLRVRG